MGEKGGIRDVVDEMRYPKHWKILVEWAFRGETTSGNCSEITRLGSQRSVVGLKKYKDHASVNKNVNSSHFH